MLITPTPTTPPTRAAGGASKAAEEQTELMTPVPEDSLEPGTHKVTTPLRNKLACGAVIGSGVWLAGNIAAQAVATGSIPGALGVAAGSLACMAAGHVAADLASGIFHHWIDNYPTYKTPWIGEMAYEFQVHHHKIHDLETQTIWSNMAASGKYMWMPMAATAAVNPHWAVQAFALGFNGGSFVAQGSHRWTHEKNPPKIAKVLQDLHITQSRKSHAIHHKMPWADNYCIVNGMWNPLLSKTHFFRKWEKLIFDVTGKEPHCWQDPGVKAFALGQINEEQFLKDQGMNREIFKKIVKGQFDDEFNRRKAIAEAGGRDFYDPGKVATRTKAEETKG